MSDLAKNISFNVDTWKVKIIERKRDRMKFQLKLNKEETEGFMEFSKQLQPDGMTQEAWVRAIFYKGLEKIQEDIMSSMQEYIAEHKDEIDASALEMVMDASAAPEVIE